MEPIPDSWEETASYTQLRILSEHSRFPDMAPHGSSLQFRWSVSSRPCPCLPAGLPAFDYPWNSPQISVLLSATGNFAPRNAVSAPEQGECPESPIMMQQVRHRAPICWPAAKEILRSCSNTTSWPKPRCVYWDEESICFCILLGAISWGTATPMDVVKSRLQADGVYLNKYKGILDCILQSYQNEGLKVSAVWRKIWVSGICLLAGKYNGCYKAICRVKRQLKTVTSQSW